MKYKSIIHWVLFVSLLFLMAATGRAQVTDWSTEGCDGTDTINDLQYRTMAFTPNGSANFYYARPVPATNFPTDPTGGTVVTLGDDDFAQATLSGAQTVAIYNTRTNVFS